MYNLPYHKEHDEQTIVEFIGRYPFAFITGCGADNNPIATQIPVFIEEKEGKKILRGHIMKNTDHHKAFLQNPAILVVFTGHHAYVSGTWYSNPHTPSTWNYMSVHIKGNIRFLDDASLIDILRLTTLHFEGNNPDSATIYDNLPPAYTEKLMKAIVAFEIEVIEMDSVFKLSQDRDAISYDNIIKRLREQDESGQVIAVEMEKRKKQVFPDEM
ncbi:MAG: FMN-binding negative transcriptional regulator [Saprospiraceae bacterium]|nr:FMN-binding negative transcriptional regulator [Saprospiraceae bacterium]MCF8249990.1 FMN-binding negative transcriptional regulator [Saprospiraceae bacterium]MCF8278970.1 FMN-binding negative transcriptional regulator [Bacteroidales bacterium]MCF8311003.1 FMN-binding negative transcriptional regulator [Saprospiraceae bacterium]MCF8439661.1 FMN-binding negative transcriptional regulator [Saprospiraceae bacterium]